MVQTDSMSRDEKSVLETNNLRNLLSVCEMLMGVGTLSVQTSFGTIGLVVGTALLS